MEASSIGLCHRAFYASAFASALMLCGATAARAGDAACLWRNLPKPVRTGIIAAYKERGGDGLDSANITNDLVRRLVRSCSGRVASDDQARGAGAALAAWSRLEPGARSVLLQQFAGAEPTAQEDAQLYGVVRSAAVSLGWNGADSKQPLRDPEFRAIADYFTGRAQADVFAAAF